MIEAGLNENEEFKMTYDLYIAMQLCPDNGYTLGLYGNWRDSWFTLHLVVIILGLLVVCGICICWAFCDCLRGEQIDVNDWDIRES